MAPSPLLAAPLLAALIGAAAPAAAADCAATGIAVRGEPFAITTAVDNHNALIKDSFEQMGISFDIYSRTSNNIHHENRTGFLSKNSTTKNFSKRKKPNSISMRKPTYSSPTVTSWVPAPVCGNENAYGDQCERCATSLSPEQLINPLQLPQRRDPRCAKNQPIGTSLAEL